MNKIKIFFSLLLAVVGMNVQASTGDVVTTLAGLSNAKTYTLQVSRGYLPNGDGAAQMYGTTDANSAGKFALIASPEIPNAYYIYSADHNKFLKNAAENTNVYSETPAGAFLLTENDGTFIIASTTTTNWLQLGGSKQFVLTDAGWKTKDAGNQWTITEADDFTDAETLLSTISALEHTAVPTAEKYYFIQSAYSQYFTKQSKYKAMYAERSENRWADLNNSDLNFVWKWTPKGNGWTVQNMGTGKYLDKLNAMSDTEPANAVGTTRLDQNQWNILFTDGGNPMHTNNHQGGAGLSGNIVKWEGGSNTASSWSIIELTADDITALANAQIAAYDNLQVGTAVGQCPAAAYATATAAKNELAADESMDNILALHDAIAAANATINWPVFTIDGTINYASGKSIYENKAGAQNHFQTTDIFDSRQLWVFEGLKSTTMEVGTYVIKNAVTGSVLNNGTANPTYTVRQTSDFDNENAQWLIYPNTASSGNNVHAQNANSVIVGWGDTANGTGSAWKINYVGTDAEIAILAEDLAAYKTLKENYEASSALPSKLGTGIGYYAEATDGALVAASNAYTSASQAFDRTQLANIKNYTADINALSTNLSNAINAITLTVPTAPGMYRIKGGTSEKYMSSDLTSGRPQIVDLTEDQKAKTIWCLTANNELVSYSGGLGFKDTHTLQEVGKAIHTWTFESAAKGVPYLALISNFNGSKYLCDWTDNIANRMNADAVGNRTHWKVEPVTEVPVTIGETGYASLNLPVATTIPAGVEAWYASATAVDGVIALKKITDDILPANCAVILYTATPNTYDFTITTGGTATSDFSGTIAAELKPATGTTYVLGKVNEDVGLYEYTGTSLPGFKMYYHDATGGNIRLQFDEITTAISAAKDNTLREGVMYNLSGQRVTKANGIVIVNGKKLVVK